MVDQFEALFGHNAAPESRSEKAILNDTLMAVSALPETIAWRHNTGQAWQGRRLNVAVGEPVFVTPGMVILSEARPITFGLQGSGDILGSSRGRPFSIEMKTRRGWQSDVQRRFEGAWVRAGGLYVLARSVEEALSTLG